MWTVWGSQAQHPGGRMLRPPARHRGASVGIRVANPGEARVHIVIAIGGHGQSLTDRFAFS